MNTHQTDRLITFTAIVAALVLPTVAFAQSSTPASFTAPTATVEVTTSPVVATPTTFGPRIEQSGITRSAVAATTPAPMSDRAVSRDVAWMIIGGAALVVGSMIGGDGGTIIMITGGVIGLMGLFRFIQ